MKHNTAPQQPVQESSKISVQELSFEQALKELETIVQKLEAGNIDLEKAISFYERGIELKEHCKKRLDDAKLKVERVVAKDGRAIDTEPSELQNLYEIKEG